jgi:hypothetical protein
VTAVSLVVAVGAVRCTCGVPGLNGRSFACNNDSECAAGYFCNPASGTCSYSSLDSGSFGGDGATGADAATDSGLDAGSDGGCIVYTSSVDPSINGSGAVVEWTAQQRFLYQDRLQNQIYYVECEAGCMGPSPSYSVPIKLGGGAPEPAGFIVEPPGLIVIDTSPIAGLWLTGSGGATYAECPGGCSSVAAWSLVALAPPSKLRWSGTDNGLGELGGLHAAALLAVDDTPDAGVPAWASYVECVAACTSASNWTSVAIAPAGLGGRGMALSDMGGGVTLRTVIFAPTGPMLYGECTSDCTQAGSWNLAHLDVAIRAKVVIDQAGLPRVFYQAENVDGDASLFVTRCLQRPCTTGSNWASTLLLSTVLTQSVGVDPSGRTWFVADDGTSLWIGIEAGSRYSVSKVTACGTSIDGANPSGYLGPRDQWRLFYNPSGSGMVFSYEAP